MLIGLHGKARSGKDTAFGFVEEYFADTAVPVYHKSFALPLKVSALAALGVKTDDPLAYCDKLKEFGSVITRIKDGVYGSTDHTITGREFLQNYGTEAHRDIFGQDFWVKACLPDDFDDTDKVVVVTDVRFPNEAERIRELGGRVWQIIRPEVDNGDAHASEQPLDPSLIDFTINNNLDLVHLRNEVFDGLTFDPALRGA